MPKPCARCGSDKIIPNIPISDHYGDLGWRARQATVEVAGKPDAFVFRDTAVSELSVNICGDCGYAELFVTGARALWDKYEQSKA